MNKNTPPPTTPFPPKKLKKGKHNSSSLCWESSRNQKQMREKKQQRPPANISCNVKQQDKTTHKKRTGCSSPVEVCANMKATSKLFQQSKGSIQKQ